MTQSSVPAVRLGTALHAVGADTCAAVQRNEPSIDEAESTLPEFEAAVTEALAEQIDGTYGDASRLVELHADLVEAGFEERSRAAEIAREIDAQSRVGGAV